MLKSLSNHSDDKIWSLQRRDGSIFVYGELIIAFPWSVVKQHSDTLLVLSNVERQLLRRQLKTNDHQFWILSAVKHTFMHLSVPRITSKALEGGPMVIHLTFPYASLKAGLDDITTAFPE